MSNCLIYALNKWFIEGGYVSMRKSLKGWWPHFLWSKDLKTFEHFVPLEYEEGRLFPPIFFKGYVKIGDVE